MVEGLENIWKIHNFSIGTEFRKIFFEPTIKKSINIDFEYHFGGLEINLLQK